MLDIPSVEAKQRSGPCTKRQHRRAPRTVTFQESNLTPQTTTEASPKQRSRTNRVQAHDSYSPVVPEPSAWSLNDQLYHKKMIVIGKVRPVFDMNAFVERHANVYSALQCIRQKVDVRVMKDRCPMHLALQTTNQISGDEEQQVDEKPQLNLQTYLITTKD